MKHTNAITHATLVTMLSALWASGLQETNLKPNTNISFKNYSIINCFGPANNERACWGVSILVKGGTPHQQITLNTTLQAVAVNINCHRPMTICSVYLPPSRSVDVVELRQLVKQLPKPFMLLGDFNGHHTMWGCRDINPRNNRRLPLRGKSLHF